MKRHPPSIGYAMYNELLLAADNLVGKTREIALDLADRGYDYGWSVKQRELAQALINRAARTKKEI